jgi:ABC-type transport system involved in multi-copper enzyme maturation permease subunit
MLNFLCPTCGKRLQADAAPIACPDCNWTITAVTAIADPETAAKAKVSPPSGAMTMRMIQMLASALPSRLTIVLAAIASLLAGVVLWIDLDPEPRYIVVVNLDSDRNLDVRHIVSSPDGKTLFCTVSQRWGEAPSCCAYLFDLGTGHRVLLCEEFVGEAVFEPNGTRMAGYLQDNFKVCMWDRNTGRELGRYAVDRRLAARVVTPPLAFDPSAGLVLLRESRIDENGEMTHDMIALETSKPWHGAGEEFDKLNEAQSACLIGSQRGNQTTPDGRTSVLAEKGQCVVVDNTTNRKRTVPAFLLPNPDDLIGITPNGAAVIVRTTKWRPLRWALDWFAWAYWNAGAAAYPTDAAGTLFVDAASGRTVTFLSTKPHLSWHTEYGVTPDGKTLVVLEGSQISFFDWPPATPWWRIAVGSAYVFLGVILIGKMYRGYRGLRKGSGSISASAPSEISERLRPAAVLPDAAKQLAPTSPGKRSTRPNLTDPWFGPHLPYDMIRLARKGWPTLARVIYLVALLVSLTVMWRTQGEALNPGQFAEYAQHAVGYAYTLIIIQDLLVLVLLPVYVASAIAQEKENQTLESLTLTHLTDRELVLGKLGARLMHLGAVVVSGLPILAFLHLWGNVDITMLVYFETHTFCLLISAGCVCIWVSTRAETVFGAISSSYPWLALVGFVSMVSALVMPWIAGAIVQWVDGGGVGNLTPDFLWPLLVVIPAHGFLAVVVVSDAIRRMDYLRRSERRKPRGIAGTMGLSDTPNVASVPGTCGQVRSKIHPLAWPIGDNALFWKECIKDGSSWSLNPRWLPRALGIVLGAALVYRLLFALAEVHAQRDLPLFAYDFALTTYFVAVAAYALAVVFQMTMSIAGEREHGTLVTLLMVPSDRREILLAKWFGPWVRNWPILAIGYLGALFGLACGLYGVLQALVLLVLPWPTMIFAGGMALWLSVICRRVLFANVALVGVSGVLFIAHVAAREQTGTILACFVALVGNIPWKDMASRESVGEAALLTVGHQAVLLMVGGLCVLRSFRSFNRRDYGTNV